MRRLAASLLAAVGALAPATARAGELLPDLDPLAPAQVTVQGTLLGFASRVSNRGEGPLVIRGERASTASPDMSATQIVQDTSGTPVPYPGVGVLRYIVAPDHAHWHLLEFERYALRHAADHSAAATTVKSGFCLVDGYADPTPSPAVPIAPVYVDHCQAGKPDALAVQEGISAGYGDLYPAHLEGQQIELAGLPPGRYELVHYANPTHVLRELTAANDASSLLLQLAWSATGAGEIAVIATCPDSDTCPDSAGPASDPTTTEPATTPGPVVPGEGLATMPFRPAVATATPALRLRSARGWARRAITRYAGHPLRRVRADCRRDSTTTARCRVAWPRGLAIVLVTRRPGGTFATDVQRVCRSTTPCTPPPSARQTLK